MARKFTTRCSIWLASCGKLLSGFAVAAVAAGVERASTDEVAVAVFAGHYVLAGASFDDLNTLEAQVAKIGPREMRLVDCGPGTSRALMAAAHRFQQLPLYWRVADASDPACTSPARVTVRAIAGSRPLGIDDAAAGRYWHSISP